MAGPGTFLLHCVCYRRHTRFLLVLACRAAPQPLHKADVCGLAPRERAALNSAVEKNHCAPLRFFVPSPAKNVSHETSTARGLYLSLWEGAWIGSRETSATTVRFSSRPPYLILADSKSPYRLALYYSLFAIAD